MEWLKQELKRIALPTMGTKNKLQRRLREELRTRGIDDVNTLLAAMLERMEVVNQKLLAEWKKIVNKGWKKYEQHFGKK